MTDGETEPTLQFIDDGKRETKDTKFVSSFNGLLEEIRLFFLGNFLKCIQE